MSDIYDHHDKAFRHVSAYVILKDGKRVATVAIKFPADGAGRLWAYVHWLGNEMVRGKADGYGYDKRSAAVASAASAYLARERKALAETGGAHKACEDTKLRFWSALTPDGGEYWDTRLRDAGFDVLQAV